MIVKNIRYGFSEGGMACGPIDGAVIGTINYEDKDSQIKYISLSEFEGFPAFFVSDIDIFEMLINDEFEKVDKYHVEKWNDIELMFYEDIFEQIKDRHDEISQLIRLTIAVVGLDEAATKKLIKKSVGKDVMDIKIPNDLEEEYSM